MISVNSSATDGESAATRQALPLAGVRVLELGRVFAAPFAGQTLADLGAEVIKVEHPTRGDDMRTYGPPFLLDIDGNVTRESAPYLTANRNKKSIAIDISTPDGQQTIRELAATCDVFIENFKVGTLARYGLSFPDISAVNPGIVYCSITGYGQTGPYADRGGLDSIIQAIGGLMSVTGEPKGEPQKTGTIVNDFATGLYAAVAILSALRHVEVNGGTGQHIDLALLDCGVSLLSPRTMGLLISGEEPERNGNTSFGSAPAQLFRCSDGYLMVQAGSDKLFAKLCKVLGQEQMLSDPRYVSRASRVQHLDELAPALEAVFGTRTVMEWAEALEEAEVLNAPVNTVSQSLRDPQVVHRQLVREMPHPLSGTVPTIANPIRFSATPLTRYTAPPTIGQHTEEVLADLRQLRQRKA